MSRNRVPSSGREWTVKHGDRFICDYCDDGKKMTLSSMTQHLSHCQGAKNAKEELLVDHFGRPAVSVNIPAGSNGSGNVRSREVDGGVATTSRNQRPRIAVCPSCDTKNPSKIFECRHPDCQELVCYKEDSDDETEWSALLISYHYGCARLCFNSEDDPSKKNCRHLYCHRHVSLVIDRLICSVCMEAGHEISPDYWD